MALDEPLSLSINLKYARTQVTSSSSSSSSSSFFYFFFLLLLLSSTSSFFFHLFFLFAPPYIHIHVHTRTLKKRHFVSTFIFFAVDVLQVYSSICNHYPSHHYLSLFHSQEGILIHKPAVKGSDQSFVGKIQKTLEGFLEENEEGNFPLNTFFSFYNHCFYSY